MDIKELEDVVRNHEGRIRALERRAAECKKKLKAQGVLA